MRLRVERDKSGVPIRASRLQVIVGHMGEGLPFLLPRLQHWLDEQRAGEVGGTAKRRPSHYFARNFHLTTSGHFHACQFEAAVEEIGLDRVMFSVDYPYEQMDGAGRWFDDMGIDADAKRRIGRDNAARLFKLDLPELSEADVLGFAS